MKFSSPHGQGRTLADRSRPAVLLETRAKIRTTWRPHPHQEPMLAVDHGFIACVGGLGAGKSECAVLLVLRWIFANPRRKDGKPTRWLFLGPDFALVKLEMFEKALAQLANLVGNDGTPIPYEALVRRVHQGENPRIVLRDGQTIFGRSGTEPKRIKGHEYDGIWMDQAETQTVESFRAAFGRQRSAKKIRFVITANPEEDPGWLWDCLSGEHPGWQKVRERMKKQGGFRAFRWDSRANPSNDESVIDVIGAVFDASAPGLTEQELDGRFRGTKEAPSVGPVDFRPAFAVKHLKLAENEIQAAVLGLDIGRSRDFTWLTILSSKGVVLWMQRFNASTVSCPSEAFYKLVEDRVVAAIKAWKCPLVKMDTAMHGAAFADLLAARLVERGPQWAKVSGFRTDAPSRKSEAIEALEIAMPSGRLRIPQTWEGPDKSVHVVECVDLLEVEFGKLTVKRVGGKRFFGHPAGSHDDGIISVALAYQGIVGARGDRERDFEGWRRRGAEGPQPRPNPFPGSSPTPGPGRTFGAPGGRYTFGPK